MNKNILIGWASLFLACNTTKQTTSSVEKNSFDKQGHRGCRGLMPENTIAAMLKAIELNVTTLEMDLQISADKKVVVSHDPTFNENITTTPDGKTLTKSEGAKLLLYQMNYDSIKKYDVGLKPHPLFPRQQKVAAYKPLLSDLIDASEASARQKGKTLQYNIEIKSTPAGDGKKHPPIEEFVDLTMSVINGKRVADRSVIQSFDPRALQVMYRKYPTVTTALLIEGDDKRPLEEQLQQLGFTPFVYSPHFSLVTPELIKQCHEKNMKVIPWTVNSFDEMKKQIALGVDGIISDYPDLFSQL
jgi:glycerophosphoryl diester phosphodiesterase